MKIDINEGIGNLRTHILEDIRVSIESINTAGLEEPVPVRGVCVTDNSIMANGKLELICIYDEDGAMCADFRSKNDLLGKGFVLGRRIDTLHIEDLAAIFEELSRMRGGIDFHNLKTHDFKGNKKSAAGKQNRVFSLKKGA